ncbi:MAG: VanZ family protein [Patescibacteria group bacterium]
MSGKTKNWLLVFIWIGFIFFLSNQPGLKSGLPGQWDFLLRKLAHIAEYAILTWLLIRALKEYSINRRQILVLAISLSILYAISDEYHQSFISERQGAGQDVLIDSLGILIAAWLGRKKMINY